MLMSQKKLDIHKFSFYSFRNGGLAEVTLLYVNI